MKRIFLLITIFLISCSQTIDSINCKIPDSVNFNSTEELRMNGKVIGHIENVKITGKEAIVYFKFIKEAKLKSNTKITHHINYFGNNYFELLNGNSKYWLSKNDTIYYVEDKVKNFEGNLVNDSSFIVNPKFTIDTTLKK